MKANTSHKSMKKYGGGVDGNGGYTVGVIRGAHSFFCLKYNGRVRDELG